MLKLPYDFPHQPPKGFTYEVLPFKRNLIAIWCCNHSKFTYNDGAVAKSIWGFVSTKTGEYFAPIDHKKPGKTVDIKDTTPYSAIQLNLNPLMSAFL